MRPPLERVVLFLKSPSPLKPHTPCSSVEGTTYSLSFWGPRPNPPKPHLWGPPSRESLELCRLRRSEGMPVKPDSGFSVPPVRLIIRHFETPSVCQVCLRQPRFFRLRCVIVFLRPVFSTPMPFSASLASHCFAYPICLNRSCSCLSLPPRDYIFCLIGFFGRLWFGNFS